MVRLRVKLRNRDDTIGIRYKNDSRHRRGGDIGFTNERKTSFRTSLYESISGA